MVRFNKILGTNNDATADLGDHEVVDVISGLVLGLILGLGGDGCDVLNALGRYFLHFIAFH